jgi:hypothetical protein
MPALIVAQTTGLIYHLKSSDERSGNSFSLPDISEFDKKAGRGNPIVVSIFNHRDVGHKQYARLTGLPRQWRSGVLSPPQRLYRLGKRFGLELGKLIGIDRASVEQ